MSMCLPLKTIRPFRRHFLASFTTEERGAELFEAALVLPLLLSLLIGMVWIGRAYNVYQSLTRAAREGARFAVAPSCASCGNVLPSDGEVQGVINGALSAASLDPSQVNPTINIQRAQVLDPSDPVAFQTTGVVITFGYPFRFIVPFTSLNFTTKTITVSVQMRQES